MNVYEITKKSRDLKVGDILKLRKDQRLPADVILLRSTLGESAFSKAEEAVPEEIEQEPTSNLLETDANAPSGESEEPSTSLQGGRGSPPAVEDSEGSSDTFIRTDQLDGETDWKLRLPSPLTQTLPLSDLLRLQITAGPPEKNVNEFIGTIELSPPQPGSYDPHIDKLRQPANAGNSHGPGRWIFRDQIGPPFYRQYCLGQHSSRIKYDYTCRHNLHRIAN